MTDENPAQSTRNARTWQQRLLRLHTPERIVFLVAAVISAAVVAWSEANDHEKHRLHIYALAGAKAHEIETAVERPLAATAALAAMVHQGGGHIENFDEVAAELLRHFPGANSIQLAPGGRITHVVPLAGNERAIGHDLLTDSARNKEAILARDTGKLTLAGPFELVQGGLGAVGRMPIFMDHGNERRFWGFSSVLIRFPEVLETAQLDALQGHGLDYALWRIHPNTGKQQIIATSAGSIPPAAVDHELTLPNGKWTLSVAPVAGWISPVQLATKAALALMFSVLLAWVVRQMSEVRRGHLKREALLKRQQAILASGADGIYGVDGDGRIVFMNRAGLERLEYREDDVLGKSAHALLHHHRPDGSPYPAEACPIAHARATQRTVKRDDEVFFDRLGRPFPVEYTAAPFIGEGGQVGGVVIFRDISERRERERQLNESIAQLRETNRLLSETRNQLVQAEKLVGIGQLAAGVAHEINNPIGFVTSNFATLEEYHRDIFALLDRYDALIRSAAAPDLATQAASLREEADLEFLRNDLETMADETRDGLARVKRIVRDLLDFSRIDSTAEQVETDLHHALEAALNIARNAIKSKAEVVRAFGEIPNVRCNPGKLQQVFLNLLTNAVQAIDAEGTITLTTRVSGDEVCVEVSDTGCGMDADAVQRMFDPFYTTKPVGKGTGLGLSVSYSIVQQHGGRFEVDSIPGRGTRVRVYLPLSARVGVADGQQAAVITQ